MCLFGISPGSLCGILSIDNKMFTNRVLITGDER